LAALGLFNERLSPDDEQGALPICHLKGEVIVASVTKGSIQMSRGAAKGRGTGLVLARKNLALLVLGMSPV
jgi:hypothetical protein